MTLFLWIVAGILVLAGTVGVIFPGLPGVPLVFLGLWTGAWIGHYQRVGGKVLAVLGILTALSYGADILGAGWGAKRFGAGKAALAGASLGALAGLFFGIPGLLLGPFLGAFAAELWSRRKVAQAFNAGIGTLAGLFLGAALKFALVFAMLGIFISALIF